MTPRGALQLSFSSFCRRSQSKGPSLWSSSKQGRVLRRSYSSINAPPLSVLASSSSSSSSTSKRQGLVHHPNRWFQSSSASSSPSSSSSSSSRNTKVAVTRDSRYAKLTSQDIEFFRRELGAHEDAAAVVTDPDDLKSYNTDWMKKFHGKSGLVLRPSNAQQVSRILAYCNQRKLAVVPQGGNTGLVGGSVPVFDEIIVNMSRMNKILKLDEYSGIVSVESGCILEVLSNYLESHGFIMPLDLGAKGSCHIGGNISTNAGGLRYVRYGSLHGSVLGLEVVLPDGTIVDLLSTLRKDNTGYDLKQLFIGAEGTLGIVTKASILVPRKPKSVQVAFMGVNSYSNVLRTLISCRTELSDIVSAIEFLDRGSMELVTKHLHGVKDPLSSPHPFYMLIETHGSNSDHDSEKLSNFLENCLDKYQSIQDGTIAQAETQQKELWRIREGITEALSKEGAVYKYDISLPVHTMYDMVEKMRTRLHTKAKVVGYGHLGDGNLHLNCYTPKFDQEVFDMIEPYLFQQTALERGSVSAEHGMGLSKNQYLDLSKSSAAISLMQQLKNSIDPNHILNPYKTLPPQ